MAALGVDADHIAELEDVSQSEAFQVRTTIGSLTRCIDWIDCLLVSEYDCGF